MYRRAQRSENVRHERPRRALRGARGRTHGAHKAATNEESRQPRGLTRSGGTGTFQPESPRKQTAVGTADGTEVFTQVRIRCANTCGRAGVYIVFTRTRANTWQNVVFTQVC
eukprot:209599-Prymnesium_polylepis.1